MTFQNGDRIQFINDAEATDGSIVTAGTKGVVYTNGQTNEVSVFTEFVDIVEFSHGREIDYIEKQKVAR